MPPTRYRRWPAVGEPLGQGARLIEDRAQALGDHDGCLVVRSRSSATASTMWWPGTAARRRLGPERLPTMAPSVAPVESESASRS